MRPPSSVFAQVRPISRRPASPTLTSTSGSPGRALLLGELAVLDHRAAAHAVALPLRLDAQLRVVARRGGERRERNAALRLEAVLERARNVVLGVVLAV